MVTHSSILAWKIPWTEEPGRLQSMGSQRVGHYWAWAHTHTSFLEKCQFRSFAHFWIGLVVFLVLHCMSYLYVLKINPLSFVSFAIIFSRSEGCLFNLLIVSFMVQKLLNLISSHLFIYLFLFPLVGHKGSCCVLCHRVVCLCFSLRVLWYLSLDLILLIHFEFIFVCGVRKYSNFILLCRTVQFSQLHLLKRLSFPHCIFYQTYEELTPILL